MQAAVVSHLCPKAKTGKDGAPILMVLHALPKTEVVPGRGFLSRWLNPLSDKNRADLQLSTQLLSRDRRLMVTSKLALYSWFLPSISLPEILTS
jgi:hypothetical protein